MPNKNSHLYKNLPKYGFFGAITLIIISVMIFNSYWTGLGHNPKTQLLPKITQDYEEFKDYCTLIISLIAAIGSILSSLLIILFYGAWKEQHNKTVISDDARRTLILFINVSKKSDEIQTSLDTVSIKQYLKIEQILNGDAYKEYFSNIDLALSDLKYFLELTQDPKNKVYKEILDAWNLYNKFLKNNEKCEMNNDLEIKEKELRTAIEDKNTSLRNFLREYILLD